MKKSIILALVLVFVMASTAFAGPFADVPAKHWSYDAVSKLAQAGIIDGYGDGTFKGDRNMTRYEMAQIVGKAMEKSDKADAENKALIDKLAKEYASELDSLGVRVSNLEKKIGNITWSGQVRSWYEWVDESSNGAGDNNTDRTTRLLLFMNAPLTDDLTFKGRIWAQTGWGETTDRGTGADASMDQAYIEGKNFTFGRQGVMLGKGLTYAWFPNNDGASYTIGDDKIKLTAWAFKGENVFLDPAYGPLNIVAGDVAYKASDNLDLSLVYVKNRDSDRGGEVIKTWALGTTYTGIENVAITAEYGVNDSDRANALNAGDDAKGWVAQAKYKGADWAKPQSWGLWVGYRNAEPGFFGRNGDYIWETAALNRASGDDGGYTMDNVKGIDVGVDYTLFKNGILTLQYFDLEDELTGNVDKKSFVGQLRYMF